MKSEIVSLFPPAEPDPEQFRMTQLQTYNWGTFSEMHTVAISEVGYLFTGPSGSGKSTLLDAHAQLLTPPRWVDYNVAARENDRSTRDRTLLTYVRGAWAKNTQENREVATQYLRTGSTLSAIAETYANGAGKTIVLAQLFWIKGASNQGAEVKKLYFIFERPFDVREFESFSATQYDVRKLKVKFENDFLREDFNAYQERFRRLLGIESERALRLLHKTQSAKNLGDLNTFLREFMLDQPETFGLADKMVLQFGELSEAYEAVVKADRQIKVLQGAEQAHRELLEAEKQRNVVREVAAGIEIFKEQTQHSLLQVQIESVSGSLEQARLEEIRLSANVRGAESTLRDFKDKRSGAGGQQMERLENDIRDAEDAIPWREKKRKAVGDACRQLRWTLADTAAGMAELVNRAKDRLEKAADAEVDNQSRRDEVVAKLREAERRFSNLRTEIDSMEKNRSNIPRFLQDLRDTMAHALHISPEKLPFAGELMEVKREAADWHGALERLMRGLSLSLLVDDRYYQQVAQYLNERHIGGRLVFLRMTPHEGANRNISTASSVQKLLFSPDNPTFASWLRNEVKARYDFECVDSMHQLRSASRAVTREGTIKRSQVQHEKNDSHRVDDRSQWLMGFDNKSKLELFKQQAAKAAEELVDLQAQERGLTEQRNHTQSELLQCQLLSAYTWQDIDVGSLLNQIKQFNESLALERAARPELAELDKKISTQTTALEHAQTALNKQSGECISLENALRQFQEDLDEMPKENLSIALTPTQRESLQALIEAMNAKINLRNLSEVVRKINTELNTRANAFTSTIRDKQAEMEKQFIYFNNEWKAETADLEPVFASGTEYFERLIKLETDGLPRYRQRFFDLLREQGHQSLLTLRHQMESERLDISNRLEQVNASLEGVPFNPGTHLTIELTDRMFPEIREFQRLAITVVERAVSDEDNQESAERRFQALRTLVHRFKSQDLLDRNWKERVLDVRQHVEFLARELDEAELEIEAYASGDGKSGGQRQKLTATCLAAALCYQLGGQAGVRPRYSTIVLDEAFDKADADFTRTAMDIFKSFSFQMIVATPMKSVMTLEPYIGGACFVQNRDRRNSQTFQMSYDFEARRIIGLNQVANAEEAAVS